MRFRFVAGLFVLSALAYGQGSGEIRLQVKDASEAGIEASGSIQGLATGVHREFQTDDKGLHTFTALPFGVYRIEVERQGFAPKTLRVEVRSEAPITEAVTLTVATVETTVVVREAETLINPEAVSATQFAGPDQLRQRASSAPGRSVVDIVNSQPGWLLEANGVLHPRGSEYNVQYVINGIPLYDNRSPAFAQSLGIDEFESMTMRTSGFPAEFGRSLGGVVEIKTGHDVVPGLHGQVSLQGGSFDQKSGFVSLQYGRGKNSFGVSGEGFLTDRYLDPPVEENFTNHGSGGSISGRFERNWNAVDSTQVYFSSHRSGFLVPNELLQQAAGQREDRSAAETLGQISHTHLFSPNVVLQMRGMLRDTSAEIWSNPLATPILPAQDRGFREGYLGGSLSVQRGAHEFKAGADAIFDSIHEDFSYRITAYDLNGVAIFDPSVPPVFRFLDKRNGRQQSAFVQDQWHSGHWAVTAGVRVDHYRIVADESAWSPRLGVAYSLPNAGLVLRASYDRIFQPPAIENLLLASTDLVDQFGGQGVFLPLRPARGNYFETGFSKSIWGKLRVDGSWYLRRVDHFSDDSLLFNTGVSFPVAFNHANIHGFETKIEVPRWGRFSGFVSYSNMLAVGQLPIAGGLFLGDSAVVAGAGSFPVTQDQRNTLRARLRVEAHRRVWFAAESSYNSGLPFEIDGPSDLNFITQQYGSRILSRVNFNRGRVRPAASVDVSAGVTLYEREHRSLRLQGDVFNLSNRLNLINFSGVLSGTAVDPGRNFAVRLNATF
jgi:TonB dependent receptor